MLPFDMRCVYNPDRGFALPLQKRKPVIIHTTRDTWDAVAGVHAITDQLCTTELGDDLNRQEFKTIGEIRSVLATMLAAHGVEVD